MNADTAQVTTNRINWSPEAEALVAKYLEENGNARDRVQFQKLLASLEQLTKKPRYACRRFAHRLGVANAQDYRSWSRVDQQRLLDLIVNNPPHEVAKLMRRSTGSVRAMLQRLGMNAQMGRDWFTKLTLAEALHIRVDEVQRWIERGWLKTRTVETGRLKKQIIDADDFSEFCKKYRSEIVGRRLNAERLEFVRTYVFPPSHVELLPVRNSKKERAAYDAQQHSPAITNDQVGRNAVS